MGIFLLIGVMALSASAIFVKLANAPSSIMAFYRIFFSFCVIFIFTISKKDTRKELLSLSKKEIILGIISGISLALHYFLWFQSLNLTSVASSTVIVTLQPLFAFVAGYLFFKERYTKLAVLGFIIAVIGSVIIGWGDFQLSSRALIGDLLAFISAGFISTYFIIGQYTRARLSTFSWITLTYFFANIAWTGDIYLAFEIFSGYCYINDYIRRGGRNLYIRLFYFA